MLGPGPSDITFVQNLLTRIINLSVSMAFIAVVVMVSYAGIRYIISGGDAKALQPIHLTITWALLGALFMVLIWLILQLVQAFTGVRLIDFCLGFAPYCV